MKMTIKREINGNMIDIPVVQELPNGMYKEIIIDRKFTVYYSIDTCEFIALSKEDQGDGVSV